MSGVSYFLGSFFLGIYLLAGVVFSLVVQLIGSGQEGAWAKPYFESFLYHAIWVLLVPVAALIYVVEKKRKKGEFPPVPWKPLIYWGLYSGPAIVISSFLYFLSLSRLPLSLASACSQCYFLIVFGISIVLFKDEKVTIVRVVSIALCLGGLAMTAVSGLEGESMASNITMTNSSSANPNSKLLCCAWDGYLFLFGSMIMSAVYQIVWHQLMRPVKDSFGNSLFLGFAGLASCGVFSLALGWVGLVIGQYTGTETFELPPAGPSLDGVVISCAMDFLLNGANLFAILFVSPIFCSVGSLLLIPLNVLMQLIVVGSSPNGIGWGGMALILIGCLSFEISDVITSKINAARKRKDEEEEEAKSLVSDIQ